MFRVNKIVQNERTWSGTEVVVAILDTGVSNHPDLQGRIWQFRDFINGRSERYDDNGHGTHVCGIIGGNRYGMAPACKMIVLKVLDETGNGNTRFSMQAFRWIVENREKYNIRVVNISMGMKQHSNEPEEKRILAAVESLWDMGIVVVSAAGNLGPSLGSITIPGTQRKIITVGCYDNKHSGRGDWAKEIYKPDVVAPGAKIFSCNAFWNGDEKNRYVAKSGTSMSTPIVTGAVAKLLSKYPNMTNEEVKRRLITTGKTLNLPREWQGNGLLNVRKLMRE
jgi:serine protease AprX